MHFHSFNFHLSFPLEKELFIHSISIDACHSLYRLRYINVYIRKIVTSLNLRMPLLFLATFLSIFYFYLPLIGR